MSDETKSPSEIAGEVAKGAVLGQKPTQEQAADLAGAAAAGILSRVGAWARGRGGFWNAVLGWIS